MKKAISIFSAVVLGSLIGSASANERMVLTDAQMDGITAGAIYLYPDAFYGGVPLVLTQSDGNLVDNGFNDVISSIVVTNGETWTLFKDIGWRGEQVPVSASGGINSSGRYPTPDHFGGKNDFFSSVMKN